MLKVLVAGFAPPVILAIAVWAHYHEPAHAAVPPVAYPATVVSVIDGDTVKVHVPGFPVAFDPIGVRINGIDTPEHVMPRPNRPARSHSA